jgi:hypothetical protein
LLLLRLRFLLFFLLKTDWDNSSTCSGVGVDGAAALDHLQLVGDLGVNMAVVTELHGEEI